MKRCLMLLVALATIPSTYALPTGEFPIAARQIGLAPYARRHPEVAASSSQFLAVWEDARVVSNQPWLWAARVGRDGKLLDPTGLPIVAFAADSLIGTHLRNVTSDGTDFLVSWSDDANRLHFATVSADGKVTIAPDPQMSADAAVAVWLGDAYAVFLLAPAQPGFDSHSVGFALVDRNGSIVIRGSVGLDAVRSIAAIPGKNAGTIILGWLLVDEDKVHVAEFSSDELHGTTVTVPPGAPAGVGGHPTRLSIASDGTNIFAVWIDEGDQSGTYRARVLQDNGAPVSSVMILGDAPVERVRPTVVWNGSEYLVTYADPAGNALLRRFGANGTALAAPLTVTSGVTDITVGTAANVDDPLVVWADQHGSVEQINSDLFSSGTNTFRLSAPLLLSASFPDRSDAEVVWRGDHYLAAWRDTFDFDRVLVGRFTADGQPLDGAGINISSGAESEPPVLASNGHTAVVAWLEPTGVSSSFIDEAGHVARRSFNFPGGLPAANWNGQQYLVAWTTPEKQLVGLRMNGAGTLIDNQPVTIGPIAGDPLIGWTGNAYVVVYAQANACPAPCTNPTSTLWAQFVSPSLTAIGSPVQIGDSVVGTPAVASGAAGALIVWPRRTGNTTILRAVRAVNGAVLDAFNGLEIGEATFATAYATPAGWSVVNGPYVWSVSANGAVSARSLALPFVPVGARSIVVTGGPAPLAVYRRDPVGTEQMKQVVAHYITVPQHRERAVRH